MAFVKAAWKILVAIKDALVLLLLLLFFGLLYILLTMNPYPAIGKGGALNLRLDGVIVEQTTTIDPLDLITGAGPQMREFRARDVMRALDASVADDRVKAVVLDLSLFLGGGRATLEEIGERLDRVRKAGKPVYAYATAYTDESYALAAHATEIWADPMGGAIFAGPGGSDLYFRDAIDRLGVTAHIYRVGTYKSAVEPFLRSDQSPEAAAALSALYNEVWDNWLSTIARVRPKAQVMPIVTNPVEQVTASRGDLAKMALDRHVVDRLGSEIEFGKMVAAKVGEDEEGTAGGFASIDYDAWLAANPEPTHGSEIGVLTIAGDIIDGQAAPGTAGGDTVSNLLYDALAQRDLKALVVRVNSPGGSALASEQIRRAIAEARARGLPVVVSMGDVAASGGYWVSTSADLIFAQPNTITGSIGIFAMVPSFEKALAKWGIHSDGVKTGPLSGEPDVLGGLSPAFDRVAQSAIEHGYRQFLTRVANARGKSMAEVDKIGQGRIWAGGTARQIGLIDQFGGLDDALAEAARRAKLPEGNWHAVWLESESDLPSRVIADMLTGNGKGTRMDLFALASMRQKMAFVRAERLATLLAAGEGMQARCLECAASLPAPLAAPRQSWWALAQWLH